MQRCHYCDCFRAAIIDFWENICVNFQVQSVRMQTHKRKSYERVNLECRIWYCLCMRAKSIKWFNVESSYSSILEKKQYDEFHSLLSFLNRWYNKLTPMHIMKIMKKTSFCWWKLATFFFEWQKREEYKSLFLRSTDVDYYLPVVFREQSKQRRNSWFSQTIASRYKYSVQFYTSTHYKTHLNAK